VFNYIRLKETSTAPCWREDATGKQKFSCRLQYAILTFARACCTSQPNVVVCITYSMWSVLLWHFSPHFSLTPCVSFPEHGVMVCGNNNCRFDVPYLLRFRYTLRQAKLLTTRIACCKTRALFALGNAHCFRKTFR
jgi:hypothetical protein